MTGRLKAPSRVFAPSGPPGVPFVEFALDSKDPSPFPATVAAGNVNEHVGHVITRKPFEQGVQGTETPAYNPAQFCSTRRPQGGSPGKKKANTLTACVGLLWSSVESAPVILPTERSCTALVTG